MSHTLFVSKKEMFFWFLAFALIFGVVLAVLIWFQLNIWRWEK